MIKDERALRLLTNLPTSLLEQLLAGNGHAELWKPTRSGPKKILEFTVRPWLNLDEKEKMETWLKTKKVQERAWEHLEQLPAYELLIKAMAEGPLGLNDKDFQKLL